MKTVPVVLGAIVLVAVTCVPPFVAMAGNPAPHEIATFFEVEFADPRAWNCHNQDGNCLTCKNVSSNPSNVVVTHTPNANEETHMVAAGSEVRICGNIIFLPHD